MSVKQVGPHLRKQAGPVAQGARPYAHRKLHADNHVSTAATAARLHATRDAFARCPNRTEDT